MPRIASVILAACAVAPQTFDAPRVRAAEAPKPKYEQAHGAAGASKLLPGQWGLLRVVIANPTDGPVEVLTSAYFDGQSDVQYARTIWAPARSRRAAWHPALPPAEIPRNQNQVAVHSLLIDRTSGQDRVIAAPSGEVLHQGSLNVHHERPVTGMIGDDAEARLLVDVARQSQNRVMPLLVLPGDPLPPTWETLAGFDQLVICSDQVLEDAAGIIAIRRWLQDGGRLWIMLDRVTPSVSAALLGDNDRCQQLDRTSLVDWQVKDARNVAKREDGPRLQSAEPVDMLRVLASDLPPAYTVDGWPAAIWQKIGRGEVLFTTLSAEGWTRPRTPHDPPPIDALRPLPRVATAPLAALAADFLRGRTPPAPSTDVWKRYVEEEVGYRIINRTAVAAILGGFSLCLLVCGAWLARHEQLAHLGWVGPSLAAAASVALVGLGRQGRESAPDTVALAQFAELETGAPDLRVRGLMGVYTREPLAEPLAATDGGMFTFDPAARAAQSSRMVWSDMERWHWENVELPAGLSLAPFSYAARLDRPPVATATFDQLGLAGAIDAGPLEELGDAILLGPVGLNMSIHVSADGSFRAGEEDVLAEGQFAAQDILDDLRRRRQSVLQDIVPLLGRQTSGRLLLWASGFDPGFTVASGARRTDVALVSLPLRLTPPPPGSRVTVPAPLVTYEAVAGPDGSPVSPAYSNTDGRWLGPLVRWTKTTLRFQLPREVAPLRLERAAVVLRVHAPSRTVEIAGWQGRQPVSLATRNSPVGVTRFEISPADALSVDEQGALWININVGPHPREESANAATVGWRIEQVSLEASGVVGEK